MTTEVKYPNVVVKLTGNDGNAFMIMGNVQKAMQKARISQDEIKEYVDEAMAGDYNHLLQVTMRTVGVK